MFVLKPPNPVKIHCQYVLLKSFQFSFKLILLLLAFLTKPQHFPLSKATPTSVTWILKSVGSPGGRSNFHEMFEYTLLKKMVSELLLNNFL